MEVSTYYIFCQKPNDIKKAKDKIMTRVWLICYIAFSNFDQTGLVSVQKRKKKKDDKKSRTFFLLLKKKDVFW